MDINLAIRYANAYLEDWTPEQLREYAFDRLVDEFMEGIRIKRGDGYGTTTFPNKDP